MDGSSPLVLKRDGGARGLSHGHSPESQVARRRDKRSRSHFILRAAHDGRAAATAQEENASKC